MTLQQLEYLVALDDCRHFVQAADRCFVTQPTLSMQIQKLEEEMGLKLFNRNHKPLKPTRAGEAVIARARGILGRVRELEKFLITEKDSLEGELRLGVIPTLAPYLLPLFLPTFLEQFPQLQLKVYEMQTSVIIESLKNETLDLGLLVSPLEDPSISEMPLFEEPFLLYLPQGHTLSEAKQVNPARLDPRQLLILTEGHCFRNQVLNICQEDRPGATSGFLYESGSIETLMRMVDTGMGYTLIPMLSAREDTPTERIRGFSHPRPVREISLATSASFHRHKALNAMAQSILRAIPGDLARMSGKKIKIL